MVSAFDSAITASTYADNELADYFSDSAEVSAYLRFERELALVQEKLGVIPAGVGAEISTFLDSLTVDPGKLASGFLDDGIAIPSLIKTLRSQLPDAVASYLHYGVTSQDVTDTALVIRLQAVTNILQDRLEDLIGRLQELTRRHRHTLTVARTRNQNASPTVFALKIVNWLAPLQRHRSRLTELLPRLLVVQLGGAVGTLAALGSRGLEVNQGLASALNLNPAACAWHAQRDGIVEFANWLSMSAGLIGKMGQDMLLLAQSEVAEINLSNGGKSSTLPNKSNPVGPEYLVGLARYCQSQSGAMQQTLISEQERDGVSMALENLTFAPLVCAAGGSIRLANRCLDELIVDEQAMLENLSADRGLILAEAAVFELSRNIDRVAASKLVVKACSLATENNSHMIDELCKLADIDIDWQALKQAQNYLGVADKIIDQILDS